jgi:HSP20 family protein
MTDRDPFSEIERAFDVLGGQFGVDAGRVPTDIVDEGDAFVVRMTLAGYDSDDIDVQLVDDRKLTVDAERTESSEAGDGQFVQRERRQQSASRTVTLPEKVDDDAEASYEDGVLTIRLPKQTVDEDEGTDIPVN